MCVCVCVCMQEVAKRREELRFCESLEPAHSNHNLRYSAYLLYWYKSTSTDAGVTVAVGTAPV